MKSKLIKEYWKDKVLNIEKIMEEYTPYIYAVITKKNINLGNEDIEEIISDVFLAVWKNQNKLDKTKEMTAYIGGITNNIFYKKIRNLEFNTNIEDCENNLYEQLNIDFKIEQNEKNSAILQEVEHLKSEDRKIFIDYYYHSKSIKEIAIETGNKESKVKTKLFRIRKKLKQNLEKKGYGYNG